MEMRRPSMRDVATLAGVGVKTVSRVINREALVAPETEAKVLWAIKQLHYRPNVHAGNLRRGGGRTHTLGLLVGDVANPFAGAVHRAVEDCARSHDAVVFASSMDEDPQRERGAVEEFLRRNVDGLILTTIDASQAYLGPELDRGTPMVFVDRRPQGLEADTVLADNYGGACQAVQHLAAHGHARIAFLGDDERIFTAKERFRGFQDAMRDLGLPVHPELVVRNLTGAAQAKTAVASMLGAPTPPTAIFAAQNLVAVGAIDALQRAGELSRVALVGFDDMPLADLMTPGISLIAQDPASIGRMAAEKIFARLDGDKTRPAEVVVPVTLIARGSGEIPASG